MPTGSSEGPDGAADPTAILATLVRADVAFLLTGGMAVQAHGYVRITVDVDVIPRPDTANMRRLAQALRELEATAIDERGNPVGLDFSRPEALAVGDYFLTTRHGPLDLVNGVRPDLNRYDRLDRHALDVALPAVTVRVVGKDDLIAMKREAGRPQDLEDIAALTELDEGERRR